MSNKLAGVHPTLIAAVGKIQSAMGLLGFPMQVTDGVRSLAQQEALYAQGRTKPGHIVTNSDGVTNRSNHQQHADGFGHAVDCCFLVGGTPTWDVHMPWKLYGAMAEALGLRWGGSWAAIHDLPHIELP